MKKTPSRIVIKKRLKVVFVVSLLMALTLAASSLFARENNNAHSMLNSAEKTKESRLLDSTQLALIGKSSVRYRRAGQLVVAMNTAANTNSTN